MHLNQHPHRPLGCTLVPNIRHKPPHTNALSKADMCTNICTPCVLCKQLSPREAGNSCGGLLQLLLPLLLNTSNHKGSPN